MTHHKFDPTHYRQCSMVVAAKLFKHPRILGTPKMKDRLGHAFCATRAEDGFMLSCEIVGTIADEKRRADVTRFAQEKPARLYTYPGILLSYLCRDEEQEQYGGAVRGNRFFHSASGYPADVDEVVSLATGIRYGDLVVEQAQSRLALRKTATQIALWDGRVVPIGPNLFENILPDLLA